ncbi:MAG: helix-turn-helix domain-containing protein [Candidatus Thiodiazotropha sp. (ex Dulcina madagascariensis)]|nr:helix-turn-helix domain-containing protein [Candidatus Thiodiazotropha sp. (ex Dulcina madagascariensis)]
MLSKVSNPLTIIAIFSALAEGLATIALVQTPPEIQKVFIYFVMFFPTLIVILFFGVLIFKNKALYAPSDFENQEHYLEINQLKESVSNDIESDLRNIENSKLSFSEPQIIYISESLKRSLEKSDPVSRSIQIEKLLQNGPARVGEISEQLGLNKSYTYRLLSDLRNRNRVESQEVEGSKEKIWSTTY